MSTHETTEGQAFSISAFMLSITSNPLTEFRLGKAFFSPLKSLVSSRSTDPSQPYMHIYHQGLINDENSSRILYMQSQSSIKEEKVRFTSTKQSWKWRRRREAAILVSFLNAPQTPVLTIMPRFGQDLS